MSNATALSRTIRRSILEMHFRAHAGHVACSLSCTDLLVSLHFFCLKEHDTFILSKGHAATALYAVLHHKGIISDEQLLTYYKNGTDLPVHPAANKFKEIPFALGSLGHGMPIGCGIALANKLVSSSDYVFVLISDGETNEGTTWEAAHFAVQHKLDNLIVLIDKNKLQGFGRSEEVLGDTAAAEKWSSIGFDVYETDGHSVEKLNETTITIRAKKSGNPCVIIANTIKGKGVSYMENKLEWHYKPMNKEQYQQALNENSIGNA